MTDLGGGGVIRRGDGWIEWDGTFPGAMEVLDFMGDGWVFRYAAGDPSAARLWKLGVDGHFDLVAGCVIVRLEEGVHALCLEPVQVALMMAERLRRRGEG